MKREKYPAGVFVYYRDNLGDMTIAKVLARSPDRGFLTVHPRWYAAEPVVLLPLRRIHGQPKCRIPIAIIEKVIPHEPVE
jgi:hypothetical protein